jgi:hypothetical protein
VKTSEEWSKEHGVIVGDKDKWCLSNQRVRHIEWEEKISKSHFRDRLLLSECNIYSLRQR